MTSNQKEIVFSEPVSKRKESGEAKYLIQQYPYLCICKNISIVTILKKGPVDAAGTWDDNVEMEADEERRCQLSVSPRPPAWALRRHLVLLSCLWISLRLKTSDLHSNAPLYPVNPREISSFSSSWRQVILFETSHFERGWFHAISAWKFSAVSKMLFLSLIIIFRSTVMHFSQIWPPLPISETIILALGTL